MATSADPLLRLVRARPLPAGPTPTALGVDDWSFKRGDTDGTILVDLEARRAVDLLPDRRAETLAACCARAAASRGSRGTVPRSSRAA